jgi:hypothetical protein
MIWRRWLSLGCFGLVLSAGGRRASSQTEPTEQADLAAATQADAITGQSAGSAGAETAGAVTSSGGFGASVPLDLPSARGGLPIPVQVSYTERGVGAAGRGWDVPLSYIRRDTTVAHRRPVKAAGVAPQGREQVSLVLDGQRIDLVRTATAWVARRDAPAIEVHERSDNTWVMFDGHGRTYRFAQISSALAGKNLWLLQDVTGPGGSKVVLDYSVTTPTLSGTSALAIDLTGVSYNPHPTTAGCFKHAVTLSYDSPAASPLSVSRLGTTVLARLRKLTTVDVTSKESCGATPVRLRRYQLSYGVDPDTRLPRLQGVNMLGREGTPEAGTSLPIAGYAYGAATNAGALTYQAMAGNVSVNLGNSRADPPADPEFGARSITDQALLDVTGDGRPDRLVYLPSLGMHVHHNTSSTSAISFGGEVALSDGALSARDFELRASKNIVQNGLTMETVWRQMSDVNGDVTCDACGGSGQVSGVPQVVCQCGGIGWIIPGEERESSPG